MQNLWSSIVIPEYVIEYSRNGFYVLVHPEKSCSVKLSLEEYEIYQYFYKNRGNKTLDFEHSQFKDAGKLEEVLLKLLRANLFCLTKREEADNQRGPKRSVHSDAYFGLTDVCNFRCIYCYAECGPEVKSDLPKDILSYEEHCKIIDEIVDVGYKNIYFTGGEPLLNKYVFRLARYAKGRGLLCGLLSNGSLITEDNIQKFHAFDIVKISIDSNREEINDMTRGRGAYYKIIRALDLLKANHIPLAINTVLTKFNKDVIAEFIEFIDREYHPLDHTIANHISYGRGTQDDCGISFEELDKYTMVVLESKKKNVPKAHVTALPDKHFKIAHKTRCGMAAGEVFVNYKGDVYPCRMTYQDEFYLGNIFEIGLRKALGNCEDILNKIHVDNLEKCKDCRFKYLCGGGCRMLHYTYTGSIEKTSEEVCETLQRQIEYTALLDNDLM